MRGTKPTPNEIKEIEGNPGKRAMPTESEQIKPPTFDEVPEPPDWLDEVGQREWRRCGPHLVKSGLLTEADLLVFAAYCSNVSIMVKSYEDIQANGLTIPGARGEVRNPALASFASATNSLRALAAEFGLTPSSRARMKLPGDDGESLSDLIGAPGGDDAA